MLKTLIQATLSSLTLCAGTQALADSGIQWNTNAAIANGSGCQSSANDTLFLANGSDLSIVFSNLGFNLPGGEAGPLHVSKNCNVQVPFQLDDGFQPSELTQSLTFGIIKSESANAELNFNGFILGAGRQNLQPLRLNFNRGRSSFEPMAIETQNDNFERRVPADILNHCRLARRSNLTYRGELTLTGSRDNIDQNLILFTDSLDLRLDVKSKMIFCPGRRPPVPPRPIPQPPRPIPQPPRPIPQPPRPIPRPLPPQPAPQLDACVRFNSQPLRCRMSQCIYIPQTGQCHKR